MKERIDLLCIHSDKTHPPFSNPMDNKHSSFKKENVVFIFSPSHLMRKPKFWVNSFSDYPKLSSPVRIWDLLDMIWVCCLKTYFSAHIIDLLPWPLPVLGVFFVENIPSFFRGLRKGSHHNWWAPPILFCFLPSPNERTQRPEVYLFFCVKSTRRETTIHISWR